MILLQALVIVFTFFNIGFLFVPFSPSKRDVLILIALFLFWSSHALMTMIEFIIFIHITTLTLLLILKLKQLLLLLVVGFAIYGLGVLVVAALMEVGWLDPSLYAVYFFLYTLLVNLLVFLVRFFKRTEEPLFASITLLDLDSKTKRQLMVLLGIVVLWIALLLTDNVVTEWVIEVQRNVPILIFSLNLAILVICLCFVRERALFRVQKERTSLLEHEQQLLKTYVDQVKSQKHDFNLHISTIAGLLALNQIEELKRYMSDMTQEAVLINQTLIFSVPEISALLFSFENSCREKNITLKLIASTNLQNLPISHYHFNKILGNLLTNALEEAENQQDKRIILTVDDQGDYYEIVVKNTGLIDVNQIHFLFTSGTSTKGKTRGHGLAIVKDLVEKAKGTVSISLENDLVCFSLLLPKLHKR